MVLVMSVLVVDNLLWIVLALNVQPDLNDVTDDVYDSHQQELELEEGLCHHQQHLYLLFDQQAYNDQLKDRLFDRLLYLLFVPSS